MRRGVLWLLCLCFAFVCARREAPRTHLATFGGCSSSARLPAFVAEARRSGLFDSVRGYTLADLPPAFTARHADRLRPGVRGCGYWLWKPAVVGAELARMRDGDVLVYADSGSSLHPENCAAFWRYVRAAAAAPGAVVSFEMRAARVPVEAAWTKADAAEALGLSLDGPAMSSPQLHATFFYVSACAASRSLVASWLALCEARNGTLLDDTPSTAPNAACFIEHRHDQSLWSLLRKSAPGAAVVVPDDAGAGSGPIQATRCRTGAEPSCSLRYLKEAVWVVARDTVGGYESREERAERAVCEAQPRRGFGTSPRKRRGVSAPMAVDVDARRALGMGRDADVM